MFLDLIGVILFVLGIVLILVHYKEKDENQSQTLLVFGVSFLVISVFIFLKKIIGNGLQKLSA